VSCAPGRDVSAGVPNSTPSPTSQLQGGQDAGGGDFFTANEKTVIDSVAEAHLLLASITSEFWPDIKTGKQNFGLIVPTNVQFVMTSRYQDYLTHITTFNPQDKRHPYPNIDFRKHGGCVGPDGKTHDGSARKSKAGSGICLSLETLTSIPKDHLSEELAILIAHEISHLEGQGEVGAQAVQSWVSAYLKVRIDVAKFRLLVAGRFQETLRKYIAHPSTALGNQLFDEARGVDRTSKSLMYRLAYFEIQWPDANQPEYWMRRSAKISATQLKTEFEIFINQFGFAVPHELNL
jgi:hypothetical protein